MDLWPLLSAKQCRFDGDDRRRGMQLLNFGDGTEAPSTGRDSRDCLSINCEGVTFFDGRIGRHSQLIPN